MKQVTHRLKQMVQMNEAQIHPNASPLIEVVKLFRQNIVNRMKQCVSEMMLRGSFGVRIK